jgi:hypothetical protein
MDLSVRFFLLFANIVNIYIVGANDDSVEDCVLCRRRLFFSSTSTSSSLFLGVSYFRDWINERKLF